MRQNLFSTMHWHWRRLLIAFIIIYHQFLCHGSWATRTPISTMADASEASASATPSPLATTLTTLAPLIVSASEATLLTSEHFPATLQQASHPAIAAAAARMRMPERVENDGDDDEAMNKIETSAELETETTSASTENLTVGQESGVSGGRGGAAHRLKNRYKIVSVRSNCSRDSFEMEFELNRGFRGLLYAKDFPWECRARGTALTNVTLRLPTDGCGVRVEPLSDGNMEMSVRVMLQIEQKLRQSSDIERRVRCQLPQSAMGMNVLTSGLGDAPLMASGGKSVHNYRNGRMRNLNRDSNIQDDQTPDSTTIPSPAVTSSSTGSPRVRIWLELGGPDGSGAVEVGQATTLTVRAVVPGSMGVRIVDCAALDGLGESTQQLLDERGCPVDEQVMPALHTHFKPTEEGWSKPNADDLVEKTFTATFPAFKFPDRERLHVSCGVQLCKEKCPNVNCRSTEKLLLSADVHLARIEVFNSLAVTAPQIEVDRLRYDRSYNMSAEEYPPHVRLVAAEGTLCMSVSKLAISFCVLGFIFLIAVIVAICSLIRSRRRASQRCRSLSSSGGGGGGGGAARLHRADVCTSMFSSSSESAQSAPARFGSKFFTPYYPNTLPYGRVY